MSEGMVGKTLAIETPEGTFTVRLILDDLGSIYPGMNRYTVEVLCGAEQVATYAVNSYEVPRGALVDIQDVAEILFSRLAHDVASRPHAYTRPRPLTRQLPGSGAFDLVILQGSPRRFGSSAKIASWCSDEAARMGLSSQIFFLHDLSIRPCIGCYACYNYGCCPIDDDMPGIVRALESASAIVVCTPVYTGTVPAGLKAVIDRFQWLHARQKVLGREVHARGLLIAVAGQQGPAPFACTTRVVGMFMGNLGIRPAAPVLFDDLDRTRDIEKIEGSEETVRSALRALLLPGDEE